MPTSNFGPTVGLLSREMFARLIRPHSIERRLLLWLLIITLVPSLTVLAIASWAGGQAASWLGMSGSWSQVAQTGRTLIDRVNNTPNVDPQLQHAARAHAEQLSTSLTQAARWEFIGARLRALLPLFFVTLALVVAALAIWAARRMARTVSRPIRELVQWSAYLAREEELPAPTSREEREVKEIKALRRSLRSAAEEMKAARQRALEVERTRSWGEMARRVAHEMKNPLTPLRLASHRLQSAAATHPDLSEAITVITEETARLENLAARFAMLGRPVEGPRSIVDIADLLRRMVATDVPSPVAVSMTNSSAAPFVTGDYNALVQAFRNILRNAVEAVDETQGPKLHISISDVATDLHVSIADNGYGVGEDITDKVFEPDFTTRRGGTGLGLAITRQIVRAHDGDVTLRPADGGGAVCTIVLPKSGELT